MLEWNTAAHCEGHSRHGALLHRKPTHRLFHTLPASSLLSSPLLTSPLLSSHLFSSLLSSPLCAFLFSSASFSLFQCMNDTLPFLLCSPLLSSLLLSS